MKIRMFYEYMYCNSICANIFVCKANMYFYYEYESMNLSVYNLFVQGFDSAKLKTMQRIKQVHIVFENANLDLNFLFLI